MTSRESGIYGASLKKHQDKLLELMSDVILNPSFPESELNRIKRETISGIASQKDDPNAVAGIVGNVVLDAGDRGDLTVLGGGRLQRVGHDGSPECAGLGRSHGRAGGPPVVEGPDWCRRRAAGADRGTPHGGGR